MFIHDLHRNGYSAYRGAPSDGYTNAYGRHHYGYKGHAGRSYKYGGDNYSYSNRYGNVKNGENEDTGEDQGLSEKKDEKKKKPAEEEEKPEKEEGKSEEKSEEKAEEDEHHGHDDVQLKDSKIDPNPDYDAPNDGENIQLKSKNQKVKKAKKSAAKKNKSSLKNVKGDVWDDIIDTLSDDKDFIQDTIKESDNIDGLYGKKKKKSRDDDSVMSLT